MSSDHLPLIRRANALTADFSHTPYDGGRAAGQLGLIPAGVRRPVIVTRAETALEIGSPRHMTSSNLLWTRENIFDCDEILCCGPDLAELLPGPISLGLLIMLQLESDPGGPNFGAIRNLSNRLPGYMGRSIPGKLWVRLSHDLIKSGVSLEDWGQVLVRAYREAVPSIINMRVVLVAEEPELIQQLSEIEKVSHAMANQRLKLEDDGSLSCEEFDCEACDEKPACDIIRDVIRRRSYA